MVGCRMMMRIMRVYSHRSSGCRKGCEWWNDEVKLAVAQKRTASEGWLHAKLVVAYDDYREKRKEVKRVVRRAKTNVVCGETGETGGSARGGCG